MKDPTDPNNKPLNLSNTNIGDLLFSKLKLSCDSCIEIDQNTGRCDTRELLVKNSTHLSQILTTDIPIEFKRHEITITMISHRACRVMFKGVPLSVPDEEILLLASHYGELTSGKVHRETVRLGGNVRHTLPTSNRYIEMKIHPGKPMRNYYWMTGPNQGETGRRVLVLHPNQPKQCSWCLQYPPSSTSSPLLPSHCRTGGNGKICEKSGISRASMAEYVNQLKAEGYTSIAGPVHC